MTGHNRIVTCLLVIVLVCPGIVFATDGNSKSKSEFSASLSPYSIEVISFKSKEFKTTTSQYGIAGRFAYFYNFSDLFSVGAVFAPGYHIYSKDYFNFTNLQIDARARIAPIRTADKFFSLIISAGGGADFAIRSDGAFGCYALVSCGLEGDFRLSDVSLITCGCDVGFSFHPESTYYQINPYVGYKRVF